MKNLIMGIAITILCSIFLIFQTDINIYQRQMEFVHTVAEEAAATAALELVWGDECASQDTHNYANGFIKFRSDDAAKQGLEVVKKNLRLGENLLSTNSYFSENMTIMIYTFSQDGTYCKYVNGVKQINSQIYTKGVNFSTLCDGIYAERLARYPASQQIIINYPSTVCLIDAGKPRFKDSLGLDDLTENIVKVGHYEYKHFE